MTGGDGCRVLEVSNQIAMQSRTSLPAQVRKLAVAFSLGKPDLSHPFDECFD
jgi:hypothetical protein